MRQKNLLVIRSRTVGVPVGLRPHSALVWASSARAVWQKRGDTPLLGTPESCWLLDDAAASSQAWSASVKAKLLPAEPTSYFLSNDSCDLGFLCSNFTLRG